MQVRAGVSSMNSGALLSLAEASTSFVPVVAREKAAAELVGVDPALRAEHALGQFEPGHFQAHEQRRHVGLDGHVLGDVRGQGRLAHARPGGQHDELRIVQPAGQVVEVV